MKTIELSTKELKRLQDKINQSAIFGTMKTKVGNTIFECHHTKETLLNLLIKIELNNKKPSREIIGITEN